MEEGDDLDSLLAAAPLAMQRPQWRGFGRYCEYRGKGVRAQAFAELGKFLDEAIDWPFDERRAFALWVLNSERSDVLNNALMSQPLLARLIVPTVKEWNRREPVVAETHLWLGLLRQDVPVVHLERAIEIDPDCELARQVICRWTCGDIDYNQHELPAFYIHDPRDDLKALNRVFDLCKPFTTQPWAVYWWREATQLKQEAEAWLKDHPRPGDFADH